MSAIRVWELDADNIANYHSGYLLYSSYYSSIQTHKACSILSFIKHNFNPNHFSPKRMPKDIELGM